MEHNDWEEAFERVERLFGELGEAISTLVTIEVLDSDSDVVLDYEDVLLHM